MPSNVICVSFSFNIICFVYLIVLLFFLQLLFLPFVHFSCFFVSLFRVYSVFFCQGFLYSFFCFCLFCVLFDSIYSFIYISAGWQREIDKNEFLFFAIISRMAA